MKLEIEKPEGNAMYCWYPQQSEPQPGIIELDPSDGVMRADYDPSVGAGTPADVWHGRRLWYYVPEGPWTDDFAYDFMCEIAPLAQRVLDGYEEEWDGSNTVGVLSADAADAQEHIERMINDAYPDFLSVWHPGDWWGSIIHESDDELQIEEFGRITPSSTDEQIEQLADKMNAEADEGVVFGPISTEEYLIELRDELPST